MKQRLTIGSKAKTDVESETAGRQSVEQPLEFESAESMIRFDAARTVVPPGLADRLLQEMEKNAAPLPWWKRWFR
jgi:hypothetical protein